jgi:hypothetical protein
VEQQAAWCQQAIGNVLDATAKKIRIWLDLTGGGTATSRQKDGGQKREKEETELGRGHQGECRTPEVDSTVQEKNAERILAKPQRGRGMVGSTIREPSGSHDCGSLNRQRTQATKHITSEGEDAEARVFASE